MSKFQTTVVLLGVVLATAIVVSFAVPALAASVSATAAIVTATIGSLALAQVRSDSINSVRPIVAAHLRPVSSPDDGPAGDLIRTFQELVVRNFGRSVALEVLVVFEPELPPRAAGLANLAEFYSRPVPVLVPDYEMVSVYVDPANSERVPEVVTAWITFQDQAGRSYGPEAYPLDLRVVWNRTYLRPNSPWHRSARTVTCCCSPSALRRVAASEGDNAL